MKQDAARFSLIAGDSLVPGGAEAAKTLAVASAAVRKQQHLEAMPKSHNFELVAR
jgi:hypothetical protein